MIDDNEKCKCQLAFELKNSHVFEKRSNTLLRHRDGFLSPVAINDKDGHGLKVEKLGPTFSIFNLMTAEMSLWFVLPADDIGLIHVSSS